MSNSSDRRVKREGLRLSRRQFLVSTGALVAAAACSTAPGGQSGGQPQGGTLPGGTVKLTAWTIGPDAPSFYRKDNLIAAAATLNKELEKENPKTTVEVDATFESGGSWGDYLQKFQLAAEAKQTPDIVLAGQSNFAPWVGPGYIIALDDYLKKHESKFKDMIPTLWDSVKLRGKTYAIPQDTEARPMYYRKDLLPKLGWSKERIDGLPDAVKKGDFAMTDLLATAKEAVDKGVVEAGKGWYPRPTKGHDHYMWYYANGGEMQDKATGKLVIVPSALEKHFGVYANAIGTKVTSATHIGSDFKIWHQTVTAGKVLFYNAGTWTWKEWASTYKVPEAELFEKVGFTLIPAAQKGGKPTTLSHPLVYMVTSNSKTPELALRLIAHATTPELNSRHAVESAHLAILKTQQDDPTYKKDKFLLATGYMSDFTNFVPIHAKYGAYDEVLFRFLSGVATGQLTPKAATEQAVAELKNQLRDELITK